MGKKVSKDRVEIKNAIEVNQEQIKGHLNELVRQSGQAAATVQLVLLELELAGRVERHAGAKISLV